MKNKLVICILFNLLFISILVAAQESNKVYQLTLNYKKQAFFESLSLIDIKIAEGSAPNYSLEPATGYRLEIVSYDNQVLKSIKFTIPIGSVQFKGIASDNAQGSADDLTFTLTVPYFNNAKQINFYDNNNNKVLEVQTTQFIEGRELEGEIEVIHADDFEHPENSRFFFYLRTGTKRYELESDKPLPVVLSGTPIKVKGKVLDNKILVEEFNIKSLEEETLQDAESIPIIEESPPEAPKFNMNWFYLSVPILLIIGFLSYLEIKRINSHKELIQTKQKQNIVMLRNYVITNLRKGYTKEQIRNALIKNNYSFEEIEGAFRG